MALSLAIGVLTAGGLYMMLQRELVRIAFGFLLLGHAFNLILISAGVTTFRLTPILGMGDPQQMADPLPQAFILTSIVITLATTVYMLSLALVGQRADPSHHADRTDIADTMAAETETDPEAAAQQAAAQEAADQEEAAQEEVEQEEAEQEFGEQETGAEPETGSERETGGGHEDEEGRG